MNSSDLTNNTSTATAATGVVCRIWKEEYHLSCQYVSTLVAIILNIVTCPVTICMNLLVIVAVKTKPILQTMYNLLLCALAATDTVVGALVQPIYAVGEISLLTGSVSEYCTQYLKTVFLFLSPSSASLSLLALLSLERYLAMKYSLRYADIITKGRVATAVITCWVIAVLPPVFLDSFSRPVLSVMTAVFITSVSFAAIAYGHISVFLVTRRHIIRIKSEQVSQDTKKKFLEEKKAAITTSIVVGFVLFSFVPLLVYTLLRPLLLKSYFGNLFISFKPVVLSFVLINSLCNPIIYCWRSSVLRKAFFELLGRKNSVN